MVYVGALTALLDIDLEVLKGAVGDQLKGKEKLVAANMEAVELGPRLRRASTSTARCRSRCAMPSAPRARSW